MTGTHLRLRRTRVRCLLAGCLSAALALTMTPAVGDEPAGEDDDDKTVVLVQARNDGPAISPLLTGVNNDQWFDNSHGLWNPVTRQPNPQVVAKISQAGVGIVRYPGGTPASLYNWKRAIGPQEQRGCQTDARPGFFGPEDSVYGPDEHMVFVNQIGGEASIMVPFVTQTPEDAADWVEYMNAPVGTNPNGGVAWAEIRAANGHPEPYGIRYWEIGNEHDRTEQRYWMSPDTETALSQYAFGGSQPQADQLLGKDCDFRAGVASDGSAGQVFIVAYPPVVPGSAAVFVDGVAWQEVDDLPTAGPDDEAYELDPETGEVTFGDGQQGKIPAQGSQVTADYDSGPHPGFVDIYAAMKSTDASIDVCATWAPITEDTGLGQGGFPELMAETGNAEDYNCLIVHPYTNFIRQFDNVFETAREGHDEHMLGEAAATDTMETHIAAVREHGPEDTYVTVSEFGALFFGPHNARAYPSWNTAMSHATYFASQWTRLAEFGVPWAEGNTLISEAPQGLRAVLGGTPRLIYTSEAVVRESMRPLVEGGGHVVDNRVNNNPLVPTHGTDLGSSYEALASTATVDDGGQLNILVVNRHPTDAVLAQVVPAGYQHEATATVHTVRGSEDLDNNRESWESHNSIRNPNEVQLEVSEYSTGHGAFSYAFPKHSVTLIQLDPRGR